MGIDLARVAMNQATTRLRWDFRQSVEGYARHGIRQIAVWRDKMEEIGVEAAKRMLDDHGMSVTGINRAGPFDLFRAPGGADLDDAYRSIDETAALSAECLLLFPGGLPEGSRDITGARGRFSEVLDKLCERATAAGVTLALEPLHPVYAAERSILNSMRQTNDLRETFGGPCAVVVDVYHVWWEAELAAEIERAAGHIIGYHVSDWKVPTVDPLTDRGMMGDGVIDLPGIRTMVENAGYTGAVEVEIFSANDWWQRDPDEVVRISLERCATVV